MAQLASVRQPIVPPPVHTAPPVSYDTNFTDNPAENTSEDWEEKIDRFGPGMFQVQWSFFKSGKRWDDAEWLLLNNVLIDNKQQV